MHRTLTTLAVVALSLLTGCARNAATGSYQFNALSRSDEIALGQDAKPEIVAQYGGEYPDETARAYVSEVGHRVASQVEEPYQDIPWDFTLLDSDVVNAFALPGGKVFITTGLARLLKDESELAGVLGHEVGHVTAEHADKRLSQQMIISIGGAVLAGLSSDERIQLAAAGITTGAGIFALSFSREEEMESDALGVRYMSRAGYDPEGMKGVMRALAAASEGQPSQPEWLSTHPATQSRIDRLESIMRDYPDAGDERVYKRNADAYRQRMLSRLSAP